MEMTGLTTTVILTIMVYCKEKKLNKIRHGRKCIEQSPGELPRSGSFPFSPMKSGHITLLELICDNMHGIFPTRGNSHELWYPERFLRHHHVGVTD